MAERVIRTLQCTTCRRRNYTFARGKKAEGRAKLELKKFCQACGQHTPHKETKS